MPSPGSDRVDLSRIVTYALPSFALAAVGMPLVVHLPAFYASSEVGLGLAAGSVFGFMRLLDVFVDPTCGYISDQIHTRFGRRRPMLALGAPLLALGLWMVFVPGGPVSAVHLGFWLFVMYLGWSMCVIPHLSWGSELSGAYHERSRIYGWVQALTVAGMVGVLVIPAILEIAGVHDHGTQIMAMAAFSVATLLPGVALCVIFVPEPEVKLGTRAGFFRTLKFVLRNRAMRRVILIDLVEGMNQGMRGVMFFYFADIVLALPRAANSLLLLYFVSGVLCMPVWMKLSRRLGKHRALMAAYVYGCCMSPLMFFIPPGNVMFAAVVLVVTGVTYGAPAFLIRSMMADVADADAAENNTERAGLMYSFLALTAKLGIALPALALPVLGLLGFNPNAAHFAPQVVSNLRAFYILVPVGLALTCLAIAAGYPIGEREQRALRAEVDRLRAGSGGERQAPGEGDIMAGIVAVRADAPPTDSDAIADATFAKGPAE
ncbi:MAG TPA: MFS transporter [Rhizomicrobium sp.]|nr:MFS transporter [Rhizomicrobium sp.]